MVVLTNQLCMANILRRGRGADTSNRPVAVELAPLQIAPPICNEFGKDTMEIWLVEHQSLALSPTVAVFAQRIAAPCTQSPILGCNCNLKTAMVIFVTFFPLDNVLRRMCRIIFA
jgi:hypothetical protein